MDTTLTLTTDMKLVLGLVGFTMVMFLFERIRADVVALVVLVVLGLTGLVRAARTSSAASPRDAVMNVIATMILGAGLDRTGALNRLAGWLLRRAHGVEQRLLLLTSAVAGLNSSFMQNPSVMALYLPVASRLSARTGLQPVAPAAADGGGDRHGRRPDHGRQLAADPAQRPAGVGQRQPAVGRGHAASR